ncbi:MAG TPA: DUF6282 family protein [Burkholderiales bacterium]|nr:DUF6282 family protein [Burkholderiales bacterium]
MKHRLIAFALAALNFTVASAVMAQPVGFPPAPPLVSPAQGTIDFHVHSEPDVFGRSMDDIDVAVLAKRKGMRALVLKNHVTMTADRAVLVMKTVPGIEIYGGIVLNNAVGGINPAAVEWMHRMSGGRGKVVWLPTFDSDKHIKTLVDPKGSGIVVAPDGVATPQVEEVLKIIARENLVLATGHIHAPEVVAVVKRAKELGVKNILITHALTNIPGLSMEQAKQVTQLGAYIEICFLQSMTGPDAQHAWMKHWSKVPLKDVARVVAEIGARSVVLSTDLGQHGNMTHPDGMEDMITGLLKEGVSQADIDLMVKKNPARLLGLKE